MPAGLSSVGQGPGSAVGPLLLGMVLQVAGCVPSTTGVVAAQTGATGTGVLLGFALVLALLTGLSLPTDARTRG